MRTPSCRTTLIVGGLLALLPVWSLAAPYVDAPQIHAFDILPTPPAANSAITQADLAELHRLQTLRTPAQVMRAVADENDESIFLFRDVLGSDFTPAALPLTAALGARVNETESAIVDPAKNDFKRVRPYNLDKTLQPVCRTKTVADSYPSGHTTVGYLMALSLIDMIPELRDQLLARADDYAHNRLMCGVHYASDLAASRPLAYAVHAAMNASPEYQREVAAARAELRAKLAQRLTHP
jgi:acid phosphatase (class A)